MSYNLYELIAYFIGSATILGLSLGLFIAFTKKSW